MCASLFSMCGSQSPWWSLTWYPYPCVAPFHTELSSLGSPWKYLKHDTFWPLRLDPKRHSDFHFTLFWDPSSGRTQLHIMRTLKQRSTWWDWSLPPTPALTWQPREGALLEVILQHQSSLQMTTAQYLDCNLLRHSEPGWPSGALLSSWPTETACDNRCSLF